MCSVCTAGMTESAPSISNRHISPPEGFPFGIITYKGVINACVYLIDGMYVSDIPENADKKSKTPAALKAVYYIALLPFFLIKGVFSGLSGDTDTGVRVAPGTHTVRIGYWTNETKWVTRDFSVTVDGGEKAVIQTVIAKAADSTVDSEVARIEHENITVKFIVHYEHIHNYSVVNR